MPLHPPPPPRACLPRLTNTQFSRAELHAIVEEAQAAGTYVCAHAYMPDAIERAIRVGRALDGGERGEGGRQAAAWAGGHEVAEPPAPTPTPKSPACRRAQD